MEMLEGYEWNSGHIQVCFTYDYIISEMLMNDNLLKTLQAWIYKWMCNVKLKAMRKPKLWKI